MKADSVKRAYQTFYQDIKFERKELFEYMAKNYNCETVLYPGSSIHITPSFYFPHVVYVDISTRAIDFFHHEESVAALIATYKTYKRSAYYEFLAKDFNKDLGLREASYDLLISLFSGTMLLACEKYLKVGGLVVSNSFFSDHESIIKSGRFELLHALTVQHQKIKLLSGDHQKKGISRSALKKDHGGFEYHDDEIYYIYKKKASS